MARWQEESVVCPECFGVRVVNISLDDRSITKKYHWKEGECQVVRYLICPDCKQKQAKKEEDEFVKRFVYQYQTDSKEAIEMLAREVYKLKKSLDNHLSKDWRESRNTPLKRSA